MVGKQSKKLKKLSNTKQPNMELTGKKSMKKKVYGATLNFLVQLRQCIYRIPQIQKIV